MLFRSKFKTVALLGLILTAFFLTLNLILPKYSSKDLIPYQDLPPKQNIRYRRLWGTVKPLESLQPYAQPRSSYPSPSKHSNGFIYAKVYGGFERIRTSICDLVVISRLLNATLVIPEIQESGRLRGISSKLRSFSYLYNEDHFISTLASDIIVVKRLPANLQQARKKKKFPILPTKHSASPRYYVREILPKLKQAGVLGLIVSSGGCLQSILPPSMDEYQRLRCRVAFHALHFRLEIQDLGQKIVERLRAWGKPYLVFHPGLVRDALAFHGCAELFQDVHTELIQYRRAQMIRRRVVQGHLDIDSQVPRKNGSCPLMPEEVGLILRAIGYPPNATVYVAGSETFGGQRLLIPLRAMFTNTIDRTSVCSKNELSKLIGPESSLPSSIYWPPPAKTDKQLIDEWKKGGPRPRPLPPPPSRPIYWHEKEGWYGWVAETDKEPDLTPADLRLKAHRLLWDALDYIVSLEADAFFPGFNNDGSEWPDFSGLVLGHRLYELASARTYRPNRTILVELFDGIRDHLYHPNHKWYDLVREHLNTGLREESLIQNSEAAKQASFLAHPFPECSCRLQRSSQQFRQVKDSNNKFFRGLDICPEWIQPKIRKITIVEEDVDESEPLDDDMYPVDPPNDQDAKNNGTKSLEQDDEMDPDD